MRLNHKTGTLALAAAFAAGALIFTTQATADHRTAKATLRDAAGNTVGHILITPHRAGARVSVSVSKLRPAGFHGFHLHANNDPTNGDGCVPPTFVSADGHFNLTGGPHGDHAGDMPVLLAMANGAAHASFVTDRFKPADAVGKAVIVHEGRNNYGNIPVGTNPDQYTPNSPAATAATAATGNAGARVFCGVLR